MPKRAFVLVALALVLGAALVWSQSRPEPLKVSGFVEADEIRVGSRVGGRVREVAADEGQRVSAGELLVQLEPFDLEEQRSQAAAMLGEKQAEAAKLTAGFREEEVAQAAHRAEQLEAVLLKLKAGPRKQEIAAAIARKQLAEAELERTRTAHARVESLFKSGASTQDDLDKATTDLRVARATVAVRTEELNLLEEGTRPEEIAEAEARVKEAAEAFQLAKNGYRAEEIAAAKAATASARAALAAIESRLKELDIVAPVDGTVEAVDLQPGDLVAANAPVVSILDRRRLWVRAYVPENHLNLKSGQTVDVTVDSFPGKRFQGTITFIARQAEFTPGNVQTPEERSKQVFRIKVTMHDPEGVLRPGMAADVWLE